MDIITLDSTNFTGLTSRYVYDNRLKFNENVMFSEQGINIPLNDALREVNDNKINNYSNIFLSRKDLLTSAVYVDDLNKLGDDGFSSYIAANAAGTLTPAARFWVVEEPGIPVNKADVSVTGDLTNINNQYFYDIELITEQLCKISHENDNVIRYLTVDYTGNLSFTKDIQLDAIGALSPQIFYYIYDRSYNYIVLIKNINDIPKYVTFDFNTQNLTLVNPVTATSVPYSVSSIFRVKPRNPVPNNTLLYDPWLSYNRDLKTNSQDVNNDRSFDNISSNLLLHSEYFNTSGKSIDLNILSLKNTNTPENKQSRGNPFFNEQSIEFREYQNLFTGSNQSRGSDNITLNYESYTTNIILKKDKVTYFHIPQIFYPFSRLNIQDSGLIEAGAIAGDHPLKSDKIFKKKADYKYTSNYGDTIEETSGEFLCAWLSGSADVNKKPIWVDRYYNPNSISFMKALTSSDLKAIRYISLFDCLANKASELLGDVDIFDKPSDLIFEKGTYYAYYHYGPKDVQNFINTLSEDLICFNFANYRYYDMSNVYSSAEATTEFAFNGKTYATTGSLSAIQASNQFTLIFDAYSSDWKSPLGYQLVGNYDRDGFGIFNQNIVTPTLFINSPSAIAVTNLQGKALNSLTFNADVKAIMRQQGLNDFYLIMEDNTFRRFNLAYAETRRTAPTNGDKLGNLLDVDYTETFGYALIDNGGANNKKLNLLDFNSNEVTDITTRTARYPRVVAFSSSLQTGNNIDYYPATKKMYITPGIKSMRVDNDIYFLQDKNTLKRWKDIDASDVVTDITTAFYSSTQIEDFSIDFDSNLWLLYNNNYYAKYTANREFILSGYLFEPGYKNYKVNFTADFNNGKYNQYCVITQRAGDSNTKLKYTQFTLDGEVISSFTTTQLNGYTSFYIANSSIPASIFSTSTTLSGVYPSGILTNTSLSAAGYFSIVSFKPQLSSFFDPKTNANLNLSNDKFLRTIVRDKYGSSNLNVKAKLTNVFNANDTVDTEIIFNLSALDAGYHNFAVRFDADNGYMYLFIDGQPQGYTEFLPRKYKFSNIVYRPFLIGSSNYAYSVPLFSYLKNTSFLANDFTVKNFYLYDTPLYNCDIFMHTRKNMEIRDISFDVACGRRNYLEEVERYFKLNTPGSKSTLFNLIIRNSGITDESLREALEQRMVNILRNTVPVHTKLNNIKWSN